MPEHLFLFGSEPPQLQMYGLFLQVAPATHQLFVVGGFVFFIWENVEVNASPDLSDQHKYLRLSAIGDT